MSVIVAVAPPAHTLQRAVPGEQGLESRDRVLAALVRVHNEPSWGLAQGFADQVLKYGVAHVPTDDFAQAAVQPHDQLEPAEVVE